MYPEDLLLAINRIGEYIEGLSFITFKRDYKTVGAVVRNFEIIWDVAIHYLPDNKIQIENILKIENEKR